MDRLQAPLEQSAEWQSRETRFDEIYSVRAGGDAYVRLGLNRSPGVNPPQVRVRAKTIEHLEIAEQVIWDVRAYLPCMGNQISDIVQTKGEAWARMRYSRGHGAFSSVKHGPVGFKNRIEFIAMRAMVAGGGCCEETAAIAYQLLASRGLSEPINLVQANSVGTQYLPELTHSFATIGDARERSDVVVVDPWPIYPLAHITQYVKFPYIWPAEQHPPRTPIFWKREPVPTVPVAMVNAYLISRNLPVIGDELLANLLLAHAGRSESNPGYREQLLTNLEPDVVHVSEDDPGQRMQCNRVPIGYWNKKQQGIAKTELVRQEFKNFFRHFVRYSPAGYDL